ncbi:MAG: putative Ig domain-containing protein [Thermomicrobiales bacterium]
MKGVTYSQTLAASGGTGPYTFTLTLGAPPSGLTLDPTTGVLSGTPTAANPFTFTVRARDANGVTGSQQYTVTISAAPLTSIALAAPSGAGNPPSIKVGQTEQFTALATYADNSKQDVTTQVQWMSSNPNVATVDPTTGKVTGQSPGTVTITATLNGMTQTIIVTVGAPTPIGISVLPAPQSRPSGATSSGATSSGPAPAPVPTGR